MPSVRVWPYGGVPALFAGSRSFGAAPSCSRASVVLEVLDGALVLLGLRARRERPEIAALAGARVELARVQAIGTRFQPANHQRPSCSRLCLHPLARSPSLVRARVLSRLERLANLRLCPSISTDRRSRGKVPPSLSKLSIEEIRERYARGDAAVTPQALNKLKRDPRHG